jgi:AcrR family transcriptional regulator
MARWQPDSRSRLLEAALELYAKRGFDNTTVAQIAERAGLTERTFFRHFADKREVLFGGAEAFEGAFVTAVADAPTKTPLLDAVAAGLEAAAAQLPKREIARQRQAIIAANPELQERELIKFAAISSALADVLRRRGVREPAASLTAEMAASSFRIAFERWVDTKNRRGLPELLQESLDQLKAVAAGG